MTRLNSLMSKHRLLFSTGEDMENAEMLIRSAIEDFQDDEKEDENDTDYSEKTWVYTFYTSHPLKKDTISFIRNNVRNCYAIAFNEEDK